MNLSSSIHDTKANPIARALTGAEIERLLKPDTNIELYSAGWFDGLTGLNAQLPHFKDYWDGYSLGYREYCCGLLGVEIPKSEIPQERLKTLEIA